MENNSKVGPNKVICLKYVLKTDQGDVLEDRNEHEPFYFIFGLSQVVAKIEKDIEGKAVGYSGKLAVSPQESFGEYRNDLLIDLPLSSFPQNVEVRPGMKFDLKNSLDEVVTVRVTQVTGDQVCVDGNHPLAGMNLIYEYEVLALKEASQQELDTQMAIPFYVYRPLN